MSTFGADLIQSAREAVAIAKGEKEPARVYTPGDVDVRTIRKALGMTQAEFAAVFGFPLPTLRDWEQGRARPDTSARAYLTVIGKAPDAVRSALAA